MKNVVLKEIRAVEGQKVGICGFNINLVRKNCNKKIINLSYGTDKTTKELENEINI